jgi:hypothetical protein
MTRYAGGTMDTDGTRRPACTRVRRGAVRAEGEEVVQVEVSPEAEEFVRQQGGRVWVWVARPSMCCWGTPAFMHAATEPPPGLSGFSPVSSAALDVWFRVPAGRVPEVLEIVLRGKRRPRVEAYWDGCIYAL